MKPKIYEKRKLKVEIDIPLIELVLDTGDGGILVV